MIDTYGLINQVNINIQYYYSPLHLLLYDYSNTVFYDQKYVVRVVDNDDLGYEKCFDNLNDAEILFDIIKHDPKSFREYLAVW